MTLSDGNFEFKLRNRYFRKYEVAGEKLTMQFARNCSKQNYLKTSFVERNTRENITHARGLKMDRIEKTSRRTSRTINFRIPNTPNPSLVWKNSKMNRARLRIKREVLSEPVHPASLIVNDRFGLYKKT